MFSMQREIEAFDQEAVIEALGEQPAAMPPCAQIVPELGRRDAHRARLALKEPRLAAAEQADTPGGEGFDDEIAASVKPLPVRRRPSERERQRPVIFVRLRIVFVAVIGKSETAVARRVRVEIAVQALAESAAPAEPALDSFFSASTPSSSSSSSRTSTACAFASNSL